MGYARTGSRVAPRRKQLGKQPDEAMPSIRGDARAAERGARTGGANEDSPVTRSNDLDPTREKTFTFYLRWWKSEVPNFKSTFRV
jgi:hypothetical protein